jgi:hypothetical protein
MYDFDDGDLRCQPAVAGRGAILLGAACTAVYLHFVEAFI